MAVEDSSALVRQSARAEALGPLPLLMFGNTIEELRELIAVPVRTERVLRACARAHPEDAHFIEKCLGFRQAVAWELERLVREGVPVADCGKWKNHNSTPRRKPAPSRRRHARDAEARFQGVRGLRFESVSQ